MEIRTTNMSLAADLVQSLCSFLDIRELSSTAEFPRMMNGFKDTLFQVDDFNAARMRLTAEMADESQHVKNLVIQAEDARLLENPTLMKHHYAQLFTLNNQLLGEYRKRSSNHQALLEALKQVNHVIQLAGRLRMGQAKTLIIKSCRSAIKNNNVHALFHIIHSGHAENPIP